MRELKNDPEVPSLETKRELLDAAIVCVTAELGVPASMPAVAVWNERVDQLYRQSLLWRNPMRLPTDFDYRIRAVLISNRAASL